MSEIFGQAALGKVIQLISPEGKLTTNGYSGIVTTIPNGGTAKFVAPFTPNDNNMRGVFLIYADFPGPAYALIFSDGTVLYAMITGGRVTITDNESSVANNLNIYRISGSPKDGGGIIVKNLLGTPRRINVVPFTF